MKKRIGIFGGAFNPVHNGHVAIADSFLKSNLVHGIWLVPTPNPPHRSDSVFASMHHRMEMLRLAFGGRNQVEIRDIESGLPSPSYSLRTLCHLHENYPDILFYLCMGMDSLIGFTGWYRYEEILKMTTLLVADRPGYEQGDVPEEIIEHVVFADHIPLEMSSSSVREGCSRVSVQVPETVYRYMEEHDLYINQD